MARKPRGTGDSKMRPGTFLKVQNVEHALGVNANPPQLTFGNKRKQ